MKTLVFHKACAAGNDFILIDKRNLPSGASAAQLAVRLCRRRFSVGADGLVILEKTSAGEIGWDFYNADGSPAEMCGNAARCAALYAVDLLGCSARLRLRTLAGPIELQFQSREKISVISPPARWLKKSERPYALIDSGVPHLVQAAPNLSERENLRTLAKTLRFPPEAGAKGANVTFVAQGNDVLQALTFERGVEDFTLACGTGALAAGVFAKEYLTRQVRNRISMPGGDLDVEVTDRNTVLTGSAEIVYRGEITR